MRKLLLLSAMILAPAMAQADVVTEVGQFVRANQTTENGYIIVYNFAPIAIPTGDVVSYTLSFSGTIFPRVGGATGINLATGNIITSVNIIPTVTFGSALIPGPNLGFPGNLITQDPAIVESYDNLNNVSIAPVGLPISLTGSSGPGVPADTFSTSNLAAVTLFATPGTPFVTEPVGSTAAFPGGASIDRSFGSGNLTLTVTFNPVPEPASMAILGAGLVGLTVLGRRRSI